MATSGDYSDLTNVPTSLDQFSNATTGFIGTSEQNAINAAIDDKLNITDLHGGLAGLVLKKQSDTDGDYAWGKTTVVQRAQLSWMSWTT